MIQSYKMIFKFMRLIPQLLLVGLFFFPIMHQKDNEDVIFTGIEAIMKGDYLIIGNMVISLVMLGAIFHLNTIFIEIILKKTDPKTESITNIVVNMTMIFGLVMVTFLGTYLEALGYVIIILLISTTYIRYLEQKKNE